MTDLLRTLTKEQLLRLERREDDYYGSFCPICKSSEFEQSGIPEVDGVVAVPYTCQECGTRWEEIYRLSSCEVDKSSISEDAAKNL